MAGKPFVSYENCESRAVFLGPCRFGPAYIQTTEGQPKYIPVAFWVEEVPAGGMVRLKPQRGEIAYLLLDEKKKIGPGTAGVLRMAVGSEEGWTKYAFDKFKPKRKMAAELMPLLIAQNDRDAVYALAVLRLNGADMSLMPDQDPVRKAWESKTITDREYAWLLFICKEQEALAALAEGSDAFKTMYLMYLMHNEQLQEAEGCLQNHREILRELLAKEHNRINAVAYAPVKMAELDEGWKKYVEKGNVLIDLDLCAVIRLELALRNSNQPEAERLAAEIKRQDKECINALTLQGQARLIPARQENPLYQEMNLLWHIGRAIGSLQKDGG